MQNRRHSSRGMKILHVILTDRLQVNQDRSGLAKGVEITQAYIDAHPTGDCREVNEAIGGTSDSDKNAQGVFNRFPCDDLRGVYSRFGQTHGLHTGGLALPQSIRMNI